MGLEPTTPCLQSRCSSQLSYVPEGTIVPTGGDGIRATCRAVDRVGVDVDGDAAVAPRCARRVYWCTRWWFAQSESDSAHGGPNPKMFGVSFHAAIQTALSGGSSGFRTIAATSRMPEQRLL